MGAVSAAVPMARPLLVEETFKSRVGCELCLVRVEVGLDALDEVGDADVVRRQAERCADLHEFGFAFAEERAGEDGHGYVLLLRCWGRGGTGGLCGQWLCGVQTADGDGWERSWSWAGMWPTVPS